EPAARPDRPHIAALPSSIVFGADFSPDGGLLAVGCYDKTILVYDARTGAARSTLVGHSERVWSVAYSPDGRTLASCSGEYSRPDVPGEVMLWDAQTGKKQLSLSGHQGLVFAVAWSPDSKTLATASWDQTVRLWDPA